MNKALEWFALAWIGLIVLANVLTFIDVFVTAPSFVSAWVQLTTIYSPFNVINWFSMIAALSPAFGAIYWKQRREKAAQERARESN